MYYIAGDMDSEIYVLFTRFKHDFPLLNFLFQNLLFPCVQRTHKTPYLFLFVSSYFPHRITLNAAKVLRFFFLLFLRMLSKYRMTMP